CRGACRCGLGGAHERTQIPADRERIEHLAPGARLVVPIAAAGPGRPAIRLAPDRSLAETQPERSMVKGAKSGPGGRRTPPEPRACALLLLERGAADPGGDNIGRAH